MVISVTDFKTHCLRVLREVEEKNQPVEVSRQGRVRFRIVPVRKPETPAWKRLRQSGILTARPGESVLSDSDFEANR
ncbi:MAG: type II toxin-antitoxin system Phd/YefM family antitoxin [Chthoniobacterales bacterium]|nr:type II toxin-antitoxin system Phd/YefM family antitoxin [Chthoniobacterales bacterium]